MNKTPLTRDQVKALGFVDVLHKDPHAKGLEYLLPRHRILSFSWVGVVGELMTLTYLSHKTDIPNDVIFIHEHKHDGYMTLSRLKSLVDALHSGR